MSSITRHILAYCVLPVTVFLFFEGCSVADSLSAYFNTYYNAQEQFSKAEEETMATLTLKQRENPLIFTYNAQGATKQKLNSVIEKCSKLLQYHPESNLVDDALLMIGKSYYYLADYQKAERKFKELLDGFPESSLALESDLMLARTYYKMNDKETATVTSKDLIRKAEASDEQEYGAAAAIVLAQIEVDSKNYTEAATWYRQAAEHGATADLRAVAYRNLGEMLSLINEYESAAEAFRKSFSESDNYISEFRARFGIARMRAALKRYDESLDILDELRASKNNQEFYSEIDYQIATVYRDQGEVEQAIDQFRYVDTSYARTEVAANSYYQLGQLYEGTLYQYDSARVAYNKGKNEFPNALITKDLVLRSDYHNRYASYTAEIARYDSMRTAMITPRDSSRAMAADTGQAATNSAAADSLAQAVPIQAISLDSVNARLARNEVELAGLFFTGFEIPDSAEFWFTKLLTDHPGSPFVPRALFSLAQLYTRDSTGTTGGIDSLYRRIIRDYPTSEFADASRRILGLPPDLRNRHGAETAYLAGERLLRKGSKTAIDSLKEVIRLYPNSPFAAKAQYAIGWFYEHSRDQSDSALASYKKVIALYPSSEYARKVRPLVEVAEIEKKKALAAPDSSIAVKDTLVQAPKPSDERRPGEDQQTVPPRPPKDHPEEFPKP